MPRGAVLKLSAEQASRREWALQPVEGKKSQFEVLQPVQFKHGEEFGFLGDPETLPRALRPEKPARKTGAPLAASPKVLTARAVTALIRV